MAATTNCSTTSFTRAPPRCRTTCHAPSSQFGIVLPTYPPHFKLAREFLATYVTHGSALVPVGLVFTDSQEQQRWHLELPPRPNDLRPRQKSRQGSVALLQRSAIGWLKEQLSLLREYGPNQSSTDLTPGLRAQWNRAFDAVHRRVDLREVVLRDLVPSLSPRLRSQRLQSIKKLWGGLHFGFELSLFLDSEALLVAPVDVDSLFAAFAAAPASYVLRSAPIKSDATHKTALIFQYLHFSKEPLFGNRTTDWHSLWETPGAWFFPRSALCGFVQYLENLRGAVWDPKLNRGNLFLEALGLWAYQSVHMPGSIQFLDARREVARHGLLARFGVLQRDAAFYAGRVLRRPWTLLSDDGSNVDQVLRFMESQPSPLFAMGSFEASAPPVCRRLTPLVFGRLWDWTRAPLRRPHKSSAFFLLTQATPTPITSPAGRGWSKRCGARPW